MCAQMVITVARMIMVVSHVRVRQPNIITQEDVLSIKVAFDVLVSQDMMVIYASSAQKAIIKVQTNSMAVA